jgi:HK97 family phage portal protein
MKLFGLNLGGGSPRPPETRSIENPTVPVSASNFLQFFGVDGGNMPAVTLESALTVPAFAAGVAFLSRSLANLPLHAYRALKDGGGERIGGQLQRILNEAPNSEWGSFGMRQYFWQQVFTQGRGLAWIERAGSNVVGLWPMDVTKTVVKRVSGRKVYAFEGKTYLAADVIDVPFMLKSDQLGVHSPLRMGAKALGLALAMNAYAAGFFAGGGVPPLALVGPMPVGPDAVKRAQADVQNAIEGAREKGRSVFPIPAGFELKPVGFDPDKGQMTEARKFSIEEIARILGLPPVFIQDLSHGTFSNTEQQDLHLVKHVLAQWAKALEEELNLKLFGASNNRRYVEHAMDAIMRGDFLSRTDAISRGIQSGQLTPNEARKLENRGPLPNGDVLYIQGATVPLGSTVNPTSNPSNGGVNDPGNANPVA